MLANRKQRHRVRERHARDEQKAQTRQNLLNAALALLEQRSFDGLSLREIAREAGVVPAAFYRHFRDMGELGLALVEESMTSLREMLRNARATPATENIIKRSVEAMVTQVLARRPHFRFIGRELHGGFPVVRQAIRKELESIINELALDLGRLPLLTRWSAEDLRMIAGLMVNAMVLTASALLEAPADKPEVTARITHEAEKQLRLIILGVPYWKSAAPPP
jgi:TetR/AcrR family transcriptional regulator, fatty acid biosynthesis regulator